MTERDIQDTPEPFKYGGEDKPEPKHTVRGGKDAREFGDYGVTHDMDCPGCKDIPFTASPRSETYWSS